MVHHGDVSDPLVLVVEEEPMVREVLARYLERDGFRFDAVEHCEHAIEAFSTARPDLVLLDLMLHRVDGFEDFEGVGEAQPGDRSGTSLGLAEQTAGEGR